MFSFVLSLYLTQSSIDQEVEAHDPSTGEEEARGTWMQCKAPSQEHPGM